MKKNLSIPVSLLALAIMLSQTLAPTNTAAGRRSESASVGSQPASLARLKDEIAIHAARRGNPFINLTDGRPMHSNYAGDERAVQTLQGQARGLSLASDDLDTDGAMDLICGFEAPGGTGMVSLHRGFDSTHPRHRGALRPKAEDGSTTAPFFGPVRVFELPVAPEFLGAGDFDGDGNLDVLAASRESAALFVLRGDGHSNLKSAMRIGLPGRVTAMAVNRRLGHPPTSVAVGIEPSGAPQVLIFDGLNATEQKEPEVIALPAEATSLLFENLDPGLGDSLAISAGNELLIARRQEGKLTGEITRRGFQLTVASIAVGDFIQGDNPYDIAALLEDGSIQYLTRAESRGGEWQVMMEASVTEPASSAGARLVLTKAKVSSHQTDDLLVVDQLGASVRIVAGGPGTRQALHQVTTLDAQGGAAAALPMRLSGNALNDLVILQAGGELSLAMIAPMATFTVTNTNDSGPGSLRQAILDANANPGADAITINIPAAENSIAPAAIPIVNPLTPLPDFTDPVNIGGVGGTIDPITKEIVITINGTAVGPGANGLTITAGNSVVNGLAIGNFSGHAIALRQGGNNMILNNNLGTDDTGTENRGNGLEGLNIQNSNNNIIRGNTIVFNGDGGSVISSIGTVVQDNNLGTDATMNQQQGNRGAGFGFAGAGNSTFANNRVAFNRIGLFGAPLSGIVLRGNRFLDHIDDGIFVTNSSGLTIGGEERGAFNVFGRNGRHGVNLVNVGGTLIKGNFFGTDPQGSDLGNGVAGVNLDGTASMTQIGGPALEARNTFANNQFGILAGPITRQKLWIFNTFDQNSNLSVDIGRNGPDINDFRDLDRLSGGPLNSPELSSAVSSDTETDIQGQLHSTPNREFLIQYLWSTIRPPSGRGEGAPLGALQVTTDANGDASVGARFTAPLATGSFVSALTTDLTTGDASEVGNGVMVTGGGGPDLEVRKSGPETARCGEMVTYTITVRNVGTAAAIGAKIIDTLPRCVEDEVQVTNPEGASFSDLPNGVTTLFPRLDPGASVTITIKATLREDCGESILNLATSITPGDINLANNQDQVSTNVGCTRIEGISVSGKHVIVSGLGFQKGDQIDINGILVKTKFRGVDELLAKKGKKLLLTCDPANPGRTNVIKLIRTRNPGSPVQDTAAFATCP